MPGVLQIEAKWRRLQVLSLLPEMDFGDKKKTRVLFMSNIDGVKFRKPVKPGDQAVYAR